MKLINLTPHPVVILDEAGNVVKTIQPEGTPLRLDEEVEPLGTIDNIPVVRKTLKEEVNQSLPREEGTYYIVSLPTAQALRRPDLLVPDDLVRDEQGRILGCRRLATLV